MLTAPVLLIGGAKWAAERLFSAVWQVPWWLWVISVMVCFALTQIMAWVEQHRLVREVSGRPDVTVTANWTGIGGSFLFVLENSSSHVAVNISALDIDLPFPQRIIAEGEALKNAFKITTALPPENRWIVQFRAVDRLSGQLGNLETLNHEIVNSGSLRKNDLRGILDEYATDVEVRVPFVLVFSNLGQPKRTLAFPLHSPTTPSGRRPSHLNTSQSANCPPRSLIADTANAGAGKPVRPRPKD